MLELIFGLLNALIACLIICSGIFGFWTFLQLMFDEPKYYWWNNLFPEDD